jgi:hypothetical protein
MKKISNNIHDLDHLKSVLPIDVQVIVRLFRGKRVDPIQSKHSMSRRKT